MLEIKNFQKNVVVLQSKWDRTVTVEDMQNQLVRSPWLLAAATWKPYNAAHVFSGIGVFEEGHGHQTRRSARQDTIET